MPRERETIEELQGEYELELDKVIETVKKEKANRVLLQFPDGLKPYSLTIKDYLQDKTDKNKEYFIWLGSCFGACDIPQVKEDDFDLIVQFGHSPWPYSKQDNIGVVD